MSDKGDTVIILSSELIAVVIGEYFNKEMFKIPVKIVDLKPSSDGYAFSLSFDAVVKNRDIPVNGVSSINKSHKKKEVV